MTSLVNPESTWLLWSVILAIAMFGILSETHRVGRMLSGAVVSIFTGLALSNLGVIPNTAPVYDTITEYLLPLAIPLILFQANLRKIARQAGRLLVLFTGAMLGTVTGAIFAQWLIPLSSVGREMTAALTAAYIGGNLNLVATSNAIGLDSNDALAASVAAANIAVFIYLMVMFIANNLTWLGQWLGRIEAPRNTDTFVSQSSGVDPLQLLFALVLGTSVCAIGFVVQDRLGWPGTAILSITLISVALATIFPRFFIRLDCASAIGFALLQIFFSAIGASASIYAVVRFGPALLIFAAVILTTHFIFVLITARLFSLRLEEALVASNACALGAPTAASMALSLERNELALPGFLCGTLGYALGTFVGVGLYYLI